MRAIREAQAAEQMEARAREAHDSAIAAARRKEPVTWSDLLVPLLMAVGCGVAPFILRQTAFMKESPNGALVLLGLFVLTSLGAAITTVMHFVGLRKRWSLGQAEVASVKLGCGLALAPIAIWLLGNVRDCVAATDTPGWAIVMIALLLLILLKK